MTGETTKALVACWELVRRDDGVATDADALAQLSWMLLLKHIGDLDREDETLAVLRGEAHVPTVPAPYGWGDWASALPGSDLAFFGRDTGNALFAAVSELAGTGGALRDAIARTLAVARCPMRDRGLALQLIAALDRVDLSSPTALTEAVAWYEERLAASQGDDTALPSLGSVPETLVRLLAPAPGETALDPAFGDASFLLATHALGKEVKLTGSERNPDLFLFGMTRLILRGVDVASLYCEDSLAVQAAEIGDDARADLVLGTVPTDGESVTQDVALGFPLELRTSDPALLLLQVVARRLRRATKGTGAGTSGGRAALVVPDRALSGEGVGARVRRSLLELVRLRAVVHLPRRRSAEGEGQSILVFDRGGATRAVWFYEVAPDEPLENVLAWWSAPVERDGARRVVVEELVREEAGEVVACNLDLRRAPEPEQATETQEPVLSAHAGATPQRVTVNVGAPPLIERPELQSLGRSALFASLTGLAWGLWAYLWLPAITLVAWLCGVRLFRGQVALIDPEPYIVFLGWWIVAVALVLVLLVLWAAYNIVRYSGDRNRRRPAPVLALEDVADGFGIDPEIVRQLRKARIATIDPGALGEATIRL